MVEVFKTDVNDRDHANLLIHQIRKSFSNYKATFDLEDCDKILRVESVTGFVRCSSLINLLKDFGFTAEVLPDEIPGIGEKARIKINRQRIGLNL